MDGEGFIGVELISRPIEDKKVASYDVNGEDIMVFSVEHVEYSETVSRTDYVEYDKDGGNAIYANDVNSNVTKSVHGENFGGIKLRLIEGSKYGENTKKVIHAEHVEYGNSSGNVIYANDVNSNVTKSVHGGIKLTKSVYSENYG